jgi:hypothetical protein
MTKPYAKIVNWDDLIENGKVGPAFYAGSDYLGLEDALAGHIDKLCLEFGVFTRSLPKSLSNGEGAEPAFVVPLDDRGASKKLETIGAELTKFFSLGCEEAAKTIAKGNILEGRASNAFDTIRQIADLRDLLVRARAVCKWKKSKKTGFVLLLKV